MTGDATYYRKGFGLRAEVQQTLTADYDGHLVDLLLEVKAGAYLIVAGQVGLSAR